MNVAETEIDSEQVMLEAEASPAEVNHAFEVAYRNFALQQNLQQVESKTIPQIAEEQLGIKDLDSVVYQQAIDYLVPFALDNREIVPAYPPKANPGAPIRRGQAFTFTVNVLLKPEYELSSYDPVTVKVPPLTFDEAEVDTYLEKLADNYATFETDEPHPVGADDSFLLALEASCNGKRMDNLSTDGRTYITGMNLMPPEFEQQLMGMDVGESKSFSFEMPGAGDNGQPGMVECTVRVVAAQRKILPTINDAWVKQNMPVFKSAAELKADIKKRIEEEHKAQYEARKLQTAAAELAKRFSGSIDESIYKATQESIVRNVRAQLAQQGISMEQFVESQGGQRKFDAATALQARASLMQGYALDALFRHEKMTIEDADLNEAAAAMDPTNPARARRNMEENGHTCTLRDLAQRIKANHWLLDHANVVIEEKEE